MSKEDGYKSIVKELEMFREAAISLTSEIDDMRVYTEKLEATIGLQMSRLLEYHCMSCNVKTASWVMLVFGFLIKPFLTATTSNLSIEALRAKVLVDIEKFFTSMSEEYKAAHDDLKMNEVHVAVVTADKLMAALRELAGVEDTVPEEDSNGKIH